MDYRLIDFDAVEWDVLDRFADRTVFQTREWLRFISQTQRATPIVVELREGRTSRLFHWTHVHPPWNQGSGQFISGVDDSLHWLQLGARCIACGSARRPRTNGVGQSQMFAYGSFRSGVHSR